MASTIKLKNGTGIPLVGDLVQGEPALDLTNKRLYTEDAGGVVIEVGTNPSTLSVTGAATFASTVAGTQFNSASSNAAAPAFAVSSGNGLYNSGTNQVAISTGGVNRLTIASTGAATFAGNVSVGTALAENSVGVYAFGTTAELRIKDGEENGTAQISIYNTNTTDDSEQFFVAMNGADVDIGNKREALKLFAGGAERARIDASGNVGIGTSTPSQKLTLSNGTFQINGSSSFSGNVEIGRVDGDNNMAFATGGTERFRIAAAGAVELTGDSGAGTTFLNFTADSNATKAQISGSKSGASGGQLTFSTNNSSAALTERLRIDASGNLLVGTSTPINSSNTIQKNSYNPVLSVIDYNPDNTDSRLALNIRAGTNSSTDSSSLLIRFQRGDGTTVGSVSRSGTSSVAYNTSSDYRLKEDAVPMTGATERVKALRPINFAWKADGSRVDGFFAHEAQEVVPEAVHGSKDAMRDEEYEVTPAVEEVRDEDGNVTTEAVAAVMGTRSVPDYQGIDQSKLVPLLTATIQELIARIEALEGA